MEFVNGVLEALLSDSCDATKSWASKPGPKQKFHFWNPSIFSSLETLANELPEKTPIEFPMGQNGQGQPISVFSSFINDSVEAPEKTQFFNEALEAANYTNYLQVYSDVISKALSPLTLTTSSLYGTEINIPFSSTNKIERIQNDFDKNFTEFVKRMNIMGDKQKKFRLSFKYIEQSVTHSIIEVGTFFLKDIFRKQLPESPKTNLTSVFAVYCWIKVID